MDKVFLFSTKKVEAEKSIEEYKRELTQTGNAVLFAYFRGNTKNFLKDAKILILVSVPYKGL